jgi:NitT/TauT family transport system ATP-binding protein
MTTDSAPAVELSRVGKWFPGFKQGERLRAVQDISLVVPGSPDGEFVVLLGPSGCGKSTLIQMISGLMRPDEGEIRVFGNRVDGPDINSVMVPQAYTCFPWLTVQGNVEFGLNILRKPAADRRRTAADYLAKVGLSDRTDAMPRQLSGGMQQRVAIARTLAMRPRVVLMDEPFGALDAQTRAEMQQMLLDLWSQERNIILFITHDITEALLLADRIIVFSARPARILKDLRVPFARPRMQALVYEPDFVKLSQALLLLLKPPVSDAQQGDAIPVAAGADATDTAGAAQAQDDDQHANEPVP